MKRNGKVETGAAEGARRATGAASVSRRGGKGRFSVRRKVAVIVRMLRGEDLDTLSRELGVTAATLSSWREDFLAAGEAGLKSRAPAPEDAETARLKEMIGELTMRNELLRERCRAMEGGRPLGLRRSRP
jgi:transposase